MLEKRIVLFFSHSATFMDLSDHYTRINSINAHTLSRQLERGATS